MEMVVRIETITDEILSPDHKVAMHLVELSTTNFQAQKKSPIHIGLL